MVLAMWYVFLLLILLFLGLQGFFSMMEMALVSFDRIRLEYYLGEKNSKALQIGKLLKKPAYLFGTTLVGVNFFLQIGSECARMFFESVHLSADWAFPFQTALVVIFAELLPMFIARNFPEQVAFRGVRLLYLVSWVTLPFIWLLNGINWLIHKILFAKVDDDDKYLSREEIQKAMEGRKDQNSTVSEDKLFQNILSKVFILKNKKVENFLLSLDTLPRFTKKDTIKTVRERFQKKPFSYFLVYEKNSTNLLGMCRVRDLLKSKNEDSLEHFIKQIWYVSYEKTLFQMIRGFRENMTPFSLIVNAKGEVIGYTTLDTITQFLITMPVYEKTSTKITKKFFHRTFLASTPLEEVKKEVPFDFPCEEGATLESLMMQKLGRAPVKQESVKIGSFLFTLQDSKFLEKRKVFISNID